MSSNRDCSPKFPRDHRCDCQVHDEVEYGACDVKVLLNSVLLRRGVDIDERFDDGAENDPYKPEALDVRERKW